MRRLVNNPKEIFFLEFSVHQNNFHVADMESIIMNNQDLCKRNMCTGYVIIAGPFQDIQDAFKEIKKFPDLERRVDPIF